MARKRKSGRRLSEEEKRQTIDLFGMTGQLHDQLLETVGVLQSQGRVGVPGLFLDRGDAIDFVESLKACGLTVRLLSLSFSAAECSAFLDDFSGCMDSWAINRSLARKLPESCAEKFLGYDLICFESGGLFHSFHCNGLGGAISDRFGLHRNDFGLFDQSSGLCDVVEWLNSGDAPCEPLPWYFVKVREI